MFPQLPSVPTQLCGGREELVGLGDTGAWGLLCLKLSGSWSRHRREAQDAQSSALAVSTPVFVPWMKDQGSGRLPQTWVLPLGPQVWVLKGNHLPGGVERGLSEATHSLWEEIFHCVKISRLSVGSV